MIKALIKDFCQDIEVLNIGCKNLENAVEKGALESKQTFALLKKYLKKVKNSSADYLVLACTHYPFLREYIRKIVGSKINIIDSGAAIAKHTKNLLVKNHIKNNQKQKGSYLYFTTGNPAKFSRVASKLLKVKVASKKVKI